MKTLILKTEGMSAYGLQSFDVQRKVNHFPTRSAIIGMLGAASGIDRSDHEDLFALSSCLSIAVQVNQCGHRIVDYHTVQNFRSPNGKIQDGTKPTYREYWCDSEHTFAITGDSVVIDKLVEKVKSPVFTIYQGRKSCPMTRPLFEAVVACGNPGDAIKSRNLQGQIFSDVPAENQIATLQIRDLTTKYPRKYAMRTVHVCAKGGGDYESTH